MKRMNLLLVLFLLIMTNGCASLQGNAQDDWLDLASTAQTQMESLEHGQGICTISADYGQRVYDFTLSTTIQRKSEGIETTLTVLAPEILAEIQVTQQEGSSRLIWDDLILETGDLAGISPVSALPFLLSQLETGYIQSGTLKDMDAASGIISVFQVEIREPDMPMGEGVETTLFLDALSLTLMGGDVFQDGVRVISCGLSDFTWNFSENTESQQ